MSSRLELSQTEPKIKTQHPFFKKGKEPMRTEAEIKDMIRRCLDQQKRRGFWKLPVGGGICVEREAVSTLLWVLEFHPDLDDDEIRANVLKE